jgi:hypothetical protein
MSAFEIQDQDLIEELQKKKRVEVFVGKWCTRKALVQQPPQIGL